MPLPAKAVIEPVGATTVVSRVGQTVPVVHINAPDAHGLSHNLYSRFDVGSQGLVLHNGSAVTSSKLAGYLAANPHLYQGSAGLILNEVTGAWPSMLEGYLEVAGAPAEVVIANPNGIYCNGCGFINTPHATLTTGQPFFSDDGHLQGYAVTAGEIAIGEQGVNARNVPLFELFSRSLSVTGKVHADVLAMVTGANRVAHRQQGTEPLAVQPMASALPVLPSNREAQAPATAAANVVIDSAWLGGLYANRIRLISTDAGAGVYLNAPVASLTGDMQLDVSGQLYINELDSAGSLHIHAGELLPASTLPQADAEQAEASQTETTISLPNPGTPRLLSLGDIMLDVSGSLDVRETMLVSSGAISLQAERLFTDSQTVMMSDSGISLEQATFTDMPLGQFNTGALTLKSRHDLMFRPAAESTVLGGDLILNAAGQLGLYRPIQVGGQLMLQADSIEVARARIAADVGMRIASDHVTLGVDGQLTSLGPVEMFARSLQVAGTLASGAGMRLQAGTVSNTGLVFATGSVNAEVDQWLNGGDRQAGTLFAGTDLYWSGQTAGQGVFRNEGGLVQAGGNLHLAGHEVTNTRVGLDIRTEQTTQEDDSLYPWVLKRWITHTDSVAEPGREGQILAAGDITLAAHAVENTLSTVSAAGDVTIQGKTLTNYGLQLLQRQHYEEWRTYDDYGVQVRDERLPDQVVGHVESVIEGRRVELTVDEVLRNETGLVREDTVVPGVPISHVYGIGVGEGMEQDARAVIHDVLVSSALPIALPALSAGMFSLSTTPDHPYLIETNPLFADYREFIGSTYMLRQLGWSADDAIQRLGDGYAELSLVRHALLDMTGSRFLSADFADEQAQFIHLMDNGIYAAEQLGLSPGIQLTVEQINQLQQDIIWMEEHTVAGQRVLMPVVYLVESSTRLNQSGAIISAEQLHSDSETLENSGDVKATQQMALHTRGDLVNQGGQVRSELIQVDAGGDVINRSGQIAAHDVVVQAQGDVINETAFGLRGSRSALGGYHYMVQGARGQVSGESSVQLTAGGDIRVTGAEVDGGQIALVAGQSIQAGALSLTAASGWASTHSLQSARTEHVLGADIHAAMTLYAEAGAHIDVIASEITALGDVQMQAGKSITVTGKHAESVQSAVASEGTRGLAVFQGERQWHGSKVQAGGDVFLAANNDITVRGSDIEAAGNGWFMHGDKLAVLSSYNESIDQVVLEQRSGDALKQGQAGHYARRVEQSRIRVGGDLRNGDWGEPGERDGPGDILVSSSSFEAGGALALATAGYMSVLSEADVQLGGVAFNQHDVHDAYAYQSGYVGQTHQSASFTAGGALNLSALEGMLLHTTRIQSQQDVSVSAGLYKHASGHWQTNAKADLLVLDVADVHQRSRQYQHEKTDMPAAVAGLAGIASGVSSLYHNRRLDQHQVAQVSGGYALYADDTRFISKHSRETHTQGSLIQAGGRVLIQGGNQVWLRGATVAGSGRYHLIYNDQAGDPVTPENASLGTRVSAGVLEAPGTGRVLLENDAGALSISPGLGQHDRVDHYTVYKPDHVGAVASALLETASLFQGPVLWGLGQFEQIPDEFTQIGRTITAASRYSTVTPSSIVDSHSLLLRSAGDMTVVGSEAMTAGDMRVQVGGDLDMQAAIRQRGSALMLTEQTGLGSFTSGAQRARLYAGLAGQHHTLTQHAQTLKPVASSFVAGGQMVFDVSGDMRVTDSDVVANGVSAVVGGDLHIRPGEGFGQAQSRRRVERQHSLTLGLGNSYLDTAYVLDDVVGAAENLKSAYDAWRDVEANPALGSASDYRANVSSALLNTGLSGVAVARALAGSLENAPTLGFYTHTRLAIETQTAVDDYYSSQHRGSVIRTGAGGLNLKARNIVIEGSNVTVSEGGDAYLEAESLTLSGIASHHLEKTSGSARSHSITLASSSVSDMVAGTAVDNLLGGWVHEQYQQERASETWRQGTMWVDGMLELAVSGQTQVEGAWVGAGKVSGYTGSLTLLSPQDRHVSQGESSYHSLEAGMYGAVAAGYGQGDEQGQRTWLGQQTTFWADQGGTLYVAGNTHIDGAILGASEPGALHLNTGTLSATHRLDTAWRDEQRWRLDYGGAYHGSSQSGTNELSGWQPASTGYAWQRAGADERQLSQATASGVRFTIREGDRAAQLQGLNRNYSNRQTRLQHQQTGGLDVAGNVDYRQLTEPGLLRDIQSVGYSVQDWAVGLEYQFNHLIEHHAPGAVREAFHVADALSLGLLPFNSQDHGGLIAQMPVLFRVPDVANRQLALVSPGSDFYQTHQGAIPFMPVEQHRYFYTLSALRQAQMAGLYVADVTGRITEETGFQQSSTNGMLNNPVQALSNGFQQTHHVQGAQTPDNVELVLNYNVRHGGIADLLESVLDRIGLFSFTAGMGSGMAYQTGMFVDHMRKVNGVWGANHAVHSQGNLLLANGLKLTGQTEPRLRFDEAFGVGRVGVDTFSVMSNGSPLNNRVMSDVLGNSKITFAAAVSAPGDFVSEQIGGNYGTYLYPDKDDFSFGQSLRNRIKGLPFAPVNFLKLLTPASPHSSYGCIEATGLCGGKP